jgi:hypothetical protein
VLEDAMKPFDTFDPQYLSYDQEVTLPAEICDEWCEYDPETKVCFYNSSFGVRFCTIFLVEGSPQLDFRRNLPASDLFGLVTHSRFLLSLSK